MVLVDCEPMSFTKVHILVLEYTQNKGTIPPRHATVLT